MCPPVPAVVEVAHDCVWSTLDDALQANRLALRILLHSSTVTGIAVKQQKDLRFWPTMTQHNLPYGLQLLLA